MTPRTPFAPALLALVTAVGCRAKDPPQVPVTAEGERPAAPGSLPTPETKPACQGARFDLNALVASKECALWPEMAGKVPGEERFALEFPREIRVASGERVAVSVTARNKSGKGQIVDLPAFGPLPKLEELSRAGSPVELVSCTHPMDILTWHRVVLPPDGVVVMSNEFVARNNRPGADCDAATALEPGEYSLRVHVDDWGDGRSVTIPVIVE